MLVLSRKVSEKLILTVAPSSVPPVIEVMVAAVDRGKVRLGITGDRDAVIVEREELTREEST